MSEFGKTLAEAYAVEGSGIDLGRGVHEGALAPEAVVQVPLRIMNRHGLIAGATGTGKTVTLQTIAEQLSAAGVAVFAADVKGDLSGVASPDIGEILRVAPDGRGVISVLEADDVEAAARASPLFAKYGTRTEAESAREKLAGRLEEHEPEPAGAGLRRGRSGPAEEARRISTRRRKEAATATTGGADALGDFLRSREGKALGEKVARGVFGMLWKRL
jgi:Bacterial protein of unknown function (DUF853)